MAHKLYVCVYGLIGLFALCLQSCQNEKMQAEEKQSTIDTSKRETTIPSNAREAGEVAFMAVASKADFAGLHPKATDAAYEAYSNRQFVLFDSLRTVAAKNGVPLHLLIDSCLEGIKGKVCPQDVQFNGILVMRNGLITPIIPASSWLIEKK